MILTRDMDDRVIPDVMDDILLPQGRYPENFMFISQWEVCQEGGVKKWGTWRTLRVLDWRHDFPDVMIEVFLPQGRYLENFMMISQLEVS